MKPADGLYLPRYPGRQHSHLLFDAITTDLPWMDRFRGIHRIVPARHEVVRHGCCRSYRTLESSSLALLAPLGIAVITRSNGLLVDGLIGPCS